MHANPPFCGPSRVFYVGTSWTRPEQLAAPDRPRAGPMGVGRRADAWAGPGGHEYRTTSETDVRRGASYDMRPST